MDDMSTMWKQLEAYEMKEELEKATLLEKEEEAAQAASALAAEAARPVAVALSAPPTKPRPAAPSTASTFAGTDARRSSAPGRRRKKRKGRRKRRARRASLPGAEALDDETSERLAGLCEQFNDTALGLRAVERAAVAILEILLDLGGGARSSQAPPAEGRGAAAAPSNAAALDEARALVVSRIKNALVFRASDVYMLQIPGSFQALKAQSELLQREIADLRRKQGSSLASEENAAALADAAGALDLVEARRQSRYEGSVTFADPASAELLLGAHGAEEKLGRSEKKGRSEPSRTLTLRGAPLTVRAAPGRSPEALATVRVAGLPTGVDGREMKRRFERFGAVVSCAPPLKERNSPEAGVHLRCRQLLSALTAPAGAPDGGFGGFGGRGATDGPARELLQLCEKLAEDRLDLFFLHKNRAEYIRDARRRGRPKPRKFEIEAKTFGAGGGQGRKLGLRAAGRSGAAMPCLCCVVPAWFRRGELLAFFVASFVRVGAPFAGSLALLAVNFSVYSGVGERAMVTDPDQFEEIATLSSVLLCVCGLAELAVSYAGSVAQVGEGFDEARLSELGVVLSLMLATCGSVAGATLLAGPEGDSPKGNHGFFQLSLFAFLALLATGAHDFRRTTFRIFRRMRARRLEALRSARARARGDSGGGPRGAGDEGAGSGSGRGGDDRPDQASSTNEPARDPSVLPVTSYRRAHCPVPSVWLCLSTFRCACSCGDLSLADLCRRPRAALAQLRNPTGGDSGVVCCCEFFEHLYHPGAAGTRRMRLELKRAFERRRGIVQTEDMTTTRDVGKLVAVERLGRRIHRLKRLIRRRRSLAERRKRRPTLMRFKDFDRCFDCQVPFSFVIVPNHCQHCGYVFCDHCSNNFRDVEALALDQARICGRCAKIIDLGGKL
jgi:hypothetical protein